MFLKNLVIILCALPFVFYINISWHWHRYFEMLTGSSGPCINGSTFDFIVVGSGSAGSVVTARLAQAGHSVLLLEAGGPSSWLQGVPSAALLFQGSKFDWKYSSVSTENIVDEKLHAGFNDGWFPEPRGKVLGGTSMANWNLYIRGHSSDYDEWAELGNKGWSYKEVLPFFKKSQSLKGTFGVETKDEHHGQEGEFTVHETKHLYPFEEAFLKGVEELGYGFQDMNAPNVQEGFFPKGQVGLTDGYRRGTFKTFVEPLIQSGEYNNLNVLTYSQVTKVLFDNGKKAIGVQFKRFGNTYEMFVNNEVIVSAGAYSSPQILLLSGVGPKSDLQKFDIPVVADLPSVGKNLQNHDAFWIGFYSSADKGISATGIANMKSWYEYLTDRSGSLANVGVGANGYLKTSFAKKRNETRPDIQLYGLPWGMTIGNGLFCQESLNLNKTVMKQWVDFIANQPTESSEFQVVSTLMRPKSRGFVTLKSADYRDNPVIDGNFLSHPEDIERLKDMCRFVPTLAMTKAFMDAKIQLMPPERLICGEFEVI